LRLLIDAVAGQIAALLFPPPGPPAGRMGPSAHPALNRTMQEVCYIIAAGDAAAAAGACPTLYVDDTPTDPLRPRDACPGPPRGP